MFLMIGLGERAGSGMAKIQQGWKDTGGTLRLVDSLEPFDYTQLEMEFLQAETRGQRMSEKMSEKMSENLSEMSGVVSEKMSEMVSEKVSEIVLEYVRRMPRSSAADIAVRLGRSARTIERAIRELKSAGKLIRIGPDRGGTWKVTEAD